MTEFTTPREALEYYQAVRPDSIMGYRPYVECAVSLQLITSGALEWRAIEGVKYGKLTDKGLFMLEQLYHTETQAQLDAAHARIAELESSEHQTRYQTLTEYEGMLAAAEKRIAELEAVCRAMIGAFEIRQHPLKPDIEMTINDVQPFTEGYGSWQWKRKYFALKGLLDTLPPSE